MAAGSHREPVCRPRISIALGRTRSARRVRAAGAAGNAGQLVCGASFLCGSSGRLPDWYEWELAAAADEKVADARSTWTWRARILGWYAQPGSEPLARVGEGPANLYGLQDLHGLIWEWVEDASTLMVSGDTRTQGDPDRLAFCGAGALSAQDRENYPTLMRLAFLSSLDARSTARRLGFRCAAEASP